MITGEVKSKVDAVWNAFWAGGISNPLEVIEQLTYLLFLKGLDETPQYPTVSKNPVWDGEKRSIKASICTSRCFSGW
ncbi:type I restriction-modification system subunit M N-terminal domain-containing protein, partial [Deinococcus antarcticus]